MEGSPPALTIFASVGVLSLWWWRASLPSPWPATMGRKDRRLSVDEGCRDAGFVEKCGSL